MLLSLNTMLGYELKCTDDIIGKTKDFLFDDKDWVVRYMVADTSKWLPGQKVLLSPIFFRNPDWESGLFSINLTRKQVENAPPLDEHIPVSREYEKHFSDYYEYPYYWMHSGGLWGMGSHPLDLTTRGMKNNREADERLSQIEDPSKVHLRSANEVAGYDISAKDKEIGHVEDFIINEKTWQIRYIVVDTRNWLPGGKKVLLAQNWITGVSWAHRNVNVEMESESIENSPEFDPNIPINRSYEMRLYDFYGRPYDG